MKQITMAEFRQEGASLLDRLDEAGVIITRDGKPVARLTPIHAESAQLIGSLQGKLTIHGDIMSTDRRWHAES